MQNSSSILGKGGKGGWIKPMFKNLCCKRERSKKRKEKYSMIDECLTHTYILIFSIIFPFFSVTRRSRSDVSYSITHSLTEWTLAELTASLKSDFDVWLRDPDFWEYFSEFFGVFFRIFWSIFPNFPEYFSLFSGVFFQSFLFFRIFNIFHNYFSPNFSEYFSEFSVFFLFFLPKSSEDLFFWSHFYFS